MRLGRNITHERFLSQSVSAICQVLNAVSVMVCFKNMCNGEIIFHFKKETQNIVLLQMKGLIRITDKFRTEKISLHTYLSSTKHLFEGREILCIMCGNTLKSNKLKVNGSLKENKLARFTNSKGSF